MWNCAIAGIAAIVSLASASTEKSPCAEIDKIVKMSQNQFASVLGPRIPNAHRTIYRSNYRIPAAQDCSIAEEVLDDGRTVKSLECMRSYGSDRQEAEYDHGVIVRGLSQCPDFQVVDSGWLEDKQYISRLNRNDGNKITSFEISLLSLKGESSVHVRVATR